MCELEVRIGETYVVENVAVYGPINLPIDLPLKGKTDTAPEC